MTGELRFERISVRYGDGRRGLTAVDEVELVVPAGQVVGLVGESGSGKSSLARAAVGLAPLAGGRVLLDDIDLGRSGRRRSPVQLVFQDPYSSVDPRMTIGASISEALPRSSWRNRAQRRAEVARLLELVGLGRSRSEALPGQLSGGQRQRVGIARALASNPDVLIADEITSALDVSVQGSMLNLLRDLQRRLQLSTLFISHDLAVVRYVSDIVAVMHLGKLVEVGAAEDVLADPQHPYTRELLASAPSWTAHLDTADDDDDEPPDPRHLPGGCRYHSRCPVGPLHRPERDICVTDDPVPDAVGSHSWRVACHFAERSETDVDQAPQ